MGYASENHGYKTGHKSHAKYDQRPKVLRFGREDMAGPVVCGLLSSKYDERTIKTKKGDSMNVITFSILVDMGRPKRGQDWPPAKRLRITYFEPAKHSCASALLFLLDQANDKRLRVAVSGEWRVENDWVNKDGAHQPGGMGFTMSRIYIESVDAGYNTDASEPVAPAADEGAPF